MADLKVVAWVEFDNEYPTKIINRENIQEVIDVIKQEIIDNHVFGYGDEHPLFKDIIGDYVGVAIDKYFFLQTPDYPLFKGHHAGALKEEASIPIIVIKN